MLDVLRSSTPTAAIDRTPPRFRGALFVSGTSIPVARCRLQVFIAPRNKAGRRGQPFPKAWLTLALAETQTDAEGAFAFSLDASLLPEWAAPLLTCGDTVRLRIVPADAARSLEATPAPLPGEWTDGMRFEIAAQEPARAKIDALLKSAAAAQVGTLSALARHAAESARLGLNAVERAQAIAWIERTFLDPTGTLGKASALPGWDALRQPEAFARYREALGRAAERPAVAAALAGLEAKVGSFDGLNQIDWPIDFTDMPASRFGDAIEGLGKKFTGPWGGGIFFQPSPYIGYRDYLVETWQKYIAIRNKYPWGNAATATPAQALDQLANRFRQSFTTTVTSRSPANPLVIEIVRKILSAPKPPADLGYGIAAAALPAQGAMTPRAWLDALIAASGVSAQEFALRHRIDVGRPDSALSSPVEENIATLLAFFRDSFQSDPDPANAIPDVFKAPIVQPMMRQVAPFFLEYEEWLDATAPFYPENFLSLRRMMDSSRLRLAENDLNNGADKAWYTKTKEIMDEVDKGHAAFDLGEYRIAQGHYAAAWSGAFTQLQAKLVQDFDYAAVLAKRRAFKVSKKQELLKFEQLTQPYDMSFNTDPIQFPDWNRGRQIVWLIQFFSQAYYVWMGDTLLALGRLPEATRHYAVLSTIAVGAAEFDSESGPFDWWNDGEPNLYQAGNLPYTVMTDEREAGLYSDPTEPDEVYARSSFSIAPAVYEFRPRGMAPLWHRLERRFIALRLGEAMLAFADTLFRSNDASSIARARELYKGVLWLHGEDPGISPHWTPEPWLPGFLTNVRRNPALASQTQRASLALYKIGNGLNAYGYTDAYVPTLRYRTLKDSADRFAAFAKAAQQDFISAMSSLENLTIEELKISNLIGKALKQQDVAGEQVKIAQTGVALAQQQIDAVQKQIDAKRKELADKESFWSQLSDFMGGMVKTFTDLPFGGGKAIGLSAASEAGFSSAGAAGAAGFAGIGAAATVTAGFAVFAYAGYTTMSSMADSYNKLGDQIKALENVAMPAAKMAKTVKEGELKIAQLNSQIVAMDIRFGRDLLAYHDNRLLNSDFWVAMTNVMKRAMQRYLELGAWCGWLAERALAFEQARSVAIMRIDYWPRAMQGLTGPDLLQLDLAELEASRLAGTRAMVPFRHVVSLATDLPLAFGQLKLLGSCQFLTGEDALRAAYPGTFGHRVDTVSVALSGAAATRALRGVLINAGVSIASRDEALSPGPLAVAPTALPIGDMASSTRLSDTALPAEILRPFEGSGTTTLWRLAFSEPANLPATAGLLDVLITIEGRALFAESLLDAPAPALKSLGIMLSGRQVAPAAFAGFKDAGTDKVDISFDLKTLLPAGAGETRKIINLGVLLPGAAAKPVKATLRIGASGTDAAFVTKDGYALSNGEPLRFPGSTVPDSPLNPVIGTKMEQTLRLSFAKSANPGVDLAALTDVMLLLDYSVQS